ncbi:hypothetical protein ACLOJK_007668 [Asimina triloba]
MAFQFWILAICMVSTLAANAGAATTQVPAMFVLGDSLVDPGNNNILITLLKANYYPNECQDRSKFVFRDAFHTADAFNAIDAKQAYEGILQSTHPMNVKDLTQL